MELFALYFNLLFYIELSFGFWITWIVKKENPKIESFQPSTDSALDNVYIYIYIYKHTHTHTHAEFVSKLFVLLEYFQVITEFSIDSNSIFTFE